jgi:hypothetical protein
MLHHVSYLSFQPTSAKKNPDISIENPWLIKMGRNFKLVDMTSAGTAHTCSYVNLPTGSRSDWTNTRTHVMDYYTTLSKICIEKFKILRKMRMWTHTRVKYLPVTNIHVHRLPVPAAGRWLCTTLVTRHARLWWSVWRVLALELVYFGKFGSMWTMTICWPLVVLSRVHKESGMVRYDKWIVAICRTY